MSRFLTVVLLIMLSAPVVYAQQYDEIIVTGSRISVGGGGGSGGGGSPAIFVEKKGDFLLLNVTVINDARERSERLRDLEATIKTIITASKNHPDIKLSLVEDGFVKPLTQLAFMDSVRPGRQPDTSYANIKVKTDIPSGDTDAYKLVRKLDDFVDDLRGVGRTKITTEEDVSVSVINPFQYRDEVRNKVMAEMTSTLRSLGDGYVIVPKGLDRGVRWTRSGDLNLKFYMNYSYKIYPKTLSVEISERGEWDED